MTRRSRAEWWAWVPWRGSVLTPTLAGAVLAPVVMACGAEQRALGTGPEGQSGTSEDLSCTIPVEEIADGGVGRNGIPALSNPPLVFPDDPDASYVRPGDRVLAVNVGGADVAVPHNILWWHEIVNLDLGGERVAVTYCPLTGSGLVFDRRPLGGTEFGVSGLLFRSNLIMFDEATESLFPQMMRRAACGPENSQRLELVPAREMRWEAWRELHPDGLVVSEITGHKRPYSSNPYADYEDPDNPDIVFPFPEVDGRRPVKERVFGLVLGGDGGIAYPFGELERWSRTVVKIPAKGGPGVLFWDRSAEAAVPFFPRAGGMELTLDVRDGEFVDEETGSRWDLSGRAVAGPLEGERLEPVADGYVAFWFAWAGFQPQTTVWHP